MSGVLCVWVYDLHMFVLCSGISEQHNANHPCVHVIYTFLCLYVVVEVEQFVRCTRYDSYMCLLDVRSEAYKCWVQGRHRNVTRSCVLVDTAAPEALNVCTPSGSHTGSWVPRLALAC